MDADLDKYKWASTTSNRFMSLSVKNDDYMQKGITNVKKLDSSKLNDTFYNLQKRNKLTSGSPKLKQMY